VEAIWSRLADHPTIKAGTSLARFLLRVVRPVFSTTRPTHLLLDLAEFLQAPLLPEDIIDVVQCQR
jgi:hypothetical protein